jgi:predicted DNA binding CopG/RHH family protein
MKKKPNPVGRPPKSLEERRQSISISMSSKDIQELQKRAEQKGMTISGFIRSTSLKAAKNRSVEDIRPPK